MAIHGGVVPRPKRWKGQSFSAMSETMNDADFHSLTVQLGALPEDQPQRMIFKARVSEDAALTAPDPSQFTDRRAYRAALFEFRTNQATPSLDSLSDSLQARGLKVETASVTRTLLVEGRPKDLTDALLEHQGKAVETAYFDEALGVIKPVE